MSFITGKHLPRRTILRGIGATVALPFLDAMVPAGRLGAAVVAATDTTRFVCIEEVHGLPGCNEWGASRFRECFLVRNDWRLDWQRWCFCRPRGWRWC